MTDGAGTDGIGAGTAVTGAGVGSGTFDPPRRGGGGGLFALGPATGVFKKRASIDGMEAGLGSGVADGTGISKSRILID